MVISDAYVNLDIDVELLQPLAPQACCAYNLEAIGGELREFPELTLCDREVVTMTRVDQCGKRP
jgi:hypothetical protein